MATFRLDDVTVWRPTAAGRLVILDRIAWTASSGERWAVLGPNGAGKTTLLNLIGAVAHPSSGPVDVLGERLGRTDMAALRRRIGFLDPGLARSFSPALSAEQIVLTGATSTVLFFPERATEVERDRAAALLARLGCAGLADRPFGRCSHGERKRVLLARALMRDPELLVLDEPTDGLDLPGREHFLAGLDALAASHPELTTVVVSHHVEELPASTTHALLLRAGTVVAAGPIEETLTARSLTECFDIDVELHRAGRRLVAVAGMTAQAGL